MSRIKNYYFNDSNFNQLGDDPTDLIVDEFLSKQKIKLPSKRQLKKIEKLIKEQYAEEYAEMTETID
jgi:hypothetical protein